MFGACRRRSGELPKAALRLCSSHWDFLSNALSTALAMENSASVQCVGSDQASTSGIPCEDTKMVYFVSIELEGQLSVCVWD